jgi:hypothetical protein
MHSSRLPFLAKQQGHLPGAFENQGSLPAQTNGPGKKEHIGNPGAALAISAFINTFERLEQLLDQENTALRQNRLAALEEFNQKKNQALLELHRTAGTIGELHLDRLGIDHRPRFARLRQKLEDNLAVLQSHLYAVGAVAAIIARTIEDHESDGTYTSENTCRSGRI